MGPDAGQTETEWQKDWDIVGSDFSPPFPPLFSPLSTLFFPSDPELNGRHVSGRDAWQLKREGPGPEES